MRVGNLIHMRKILKEKREQGLCTNNTSCKNKAKEGFTTCDYHLKMSRESMRRRKARMGARII